MEKARAALAARTALHEARSRARREGRAVDWYLARDESLQRWAGLTNPGATCYLNSLLQALFLLPEVRAAVYGFVHDESRHGPAADCVAHQLARLFAQLELSRLRVLDTRSLIASFGWSQADVVRQQDVSELCRALFDELHRLGVPLSSSLFEGQLRSTLRCTVCGHESVTHERFHDVQLNIVGMDALPEALDHFVRWEHLDGDNRWCAVVVI